MYNTASEWYSDLLETYFDGFYVLLDARRSKIDPKWDPANLTFDKYGYSEWYKELDDLPPLEGDGEKYYTASSTQLLAVLLWEKICSH